MMDGENTLFWLQRSNGNLGIKKVLGRKKAYGALEQSHRTKGDR